ncbi:MAG TPA: hypothetical protein VMW35_14255 [Myxococcota bacterium]|jgi:hypothetical protein|nr:hypothetical protein [Myxococcota bacterium]
MSRNGESTSEGSNRGTRDRERKPELASREEVEASSMRAHLHRRLEHGAEAIDFYESSALGELPDMGGVDSEPSKEGTRRKLDLPPAPPREKGSSRARP